MAGAYLIELRVFVRNYLEMGFLLPSIRIRDNLDNAPDSYSIIINGSIRGSGTIESGREMAINPGNVLTQIEGTRPKSRRSGLMPLDRSCRPRNMPKPVVIPW